MEKLDEVELCDLVRADDAGSSQAREAFAELYSRSYDIAMAYAYRILLDRHRAEDAVAEAYTKTLRALQRECGPVDSFNAYLLTAVKSEANRRSAIERVTDAVDDDDEDVALGIMPDVVEDLAERDQLMRAFGSLPEARQQLLYLIDIEDQAPGAVADRLGLKLSAMNSQLFRAREDLRAAYLQQYADRAEPECSGVVALLGRFVRGGLRSRKNAEVADHLKACAPCQQQYTQLERINGSLRTWIGPVGLGLGVSAGLVAAGSGSPGAAALTFGKLQHGLVAKYALPLKWTAGVVGVGAITVVGVLLLSPQAEPGPSPSPPAVEVTPTPEPIPELKPEPVTEELPEEPQIVEPPLEEPRVEAPQPPELNPAEDDDTPDWIEVE